MCGEGAAEIVRDKIAAGHAVLQLELGVRGEAVAQRGINPPDIMAVGDGLARRIAPGREQFLIPAQRAEKLRRDFVFRLQIIGEDVGVAETRDFEASLKRFRPELQMSARVADVLPENKLPVFAVIALERLRPRAGNQIRAFRGEMPKRHA